MNRGKLEIMRDILEACSDGKGVQPILFTARTSYKYFKRYVDGMLEAGLVKVLPKTQKTRKYEVTKKGKKFLKHMKSIDR